MSGANPLKASFARVQAAEDRHAEKLRAKTAKTSAGASSSLARKGSYVKTLVSSKDRAAEHRARKAAGAEGSVVAEARVRRDDGSAITLGKALYDVSEFLKGRPKHAEASLDEIHAATGIDVGAAANALLEEKLRDSEYIEPIESAGMGLRLRYLPKHGVRDFSMLTALLGRAVVEGVPRSELLGCYEAVEADIGRLLDSGRAAAIERTDKHPKDMILYAPPSSRRAPASLVSAWKAVRVPRGDDLQVEMLKRKLISPDEIELRKSRKVLALQAKEAARKAAKPKGVRLAGRKMTNTHLDL